MISRIFYLVYGLVAYVGFLLTFLYVIGFLGNFDVVPKSVDSGVAGSLGTAVFVNLLLLILFGVYHSVAARPSFKQWLSQFVPPTIERTTYVLIADLLFALVFWQWRPMPGIVWHVEHPVGVAILWGLFALGWILVVYSSFVIDHFDLFGLRQVYLHLRGREYEHGPFMVRSLYKVIRHPLLLGWIIAFWSTPKMSAGHLLFALGNTVYIIVGLKLEEQTLTSILGEQYQRYLQRTGMFLPSPSKRGD